jgi:hypothetical protein
MSIHLAHLADLHLGYRQYGRQNRHGINQREADVASAFRQAVDDVIHVDPDLVLIAGDVFHSVRPTNPAILDAFNQLRRLRRELPSKPIVIIAGNHDTPRSVETGTILTLFEAIDNVHVIARETRSVHFRKLGLSVTGFPRTSLVGPSRRVPPPDPQASRNVLLLHGEVAGVVPGDRSFAQQAGVVLEPGELHAEEWSYVALGHYHVATEVMSNAWYAGSIEYVSTTPWMESRASSIHVPEGAKGWLHVTIDGDDIAVEFRRIQLARRHIDLQPIYCDGMTAEDINLTIRSRVEDMDGGIEDQIVRQVLFDVPRSLVRNLDHALIREYKARALQYRFDARRPEPKAVTGSIGTGRRQTLGEVVEEYIADRALTPGVSREALLELARGYLEQVERQLAEA